MKKIFITDFLICLLLIFYSCQGLTDFIPPDFEEKLCVTAVINGGSDQNKIIIEKTHQNEYPSEENAPLEDLSVIIKSEGDVVFEYFNQKSENRTIIVPLPTALEFISGNKYSLIISEKNSESITSEIVVPSVPTKPEISIEDAVQTFLPPPAECHNPVKSIVLNVKLKSEDNQFYYLDIDGYLNHIYKDTLSYFINYDVIESNSPYFESPIYGFTSLGFRSCFSTSIFLRLTYSTCFFDSKTIPENTLNTKIRIDINKEYYDYARPITITLNSIPKDLYIYEKNYFTYLETQTDPFSEPVYIKGNIKDGHGIFAICGGSQTSFVLPPDLIN